MTESKRVGDPALSAWDVHAMYLAGVVTVAVTLSATP